jgi:DNA-binding transcriptional LysR family regulator
MDMAVLYGGRALAQGLRFEPLLTEELMLVAAGDALDTRQQVALADLAGMDLLLPRAHNYLRKCVDEAFASLQISPSVVAEIESKATLSAAVAGGVCATVLPASAARVIAASIQGVCAGSFRRRSTSAMIRRTQRQRHPEAGAGGAGDRGRACGWVERRGGGLTSLHYTLIGSDTWGRIGTSVFAYARRMSL